MAKKHWMPRVQSVLHFWTNCDSKCRATNTHLSLSWGADGAFKWGRFRALAGPAGCLYKHVRELEYATNDNKRRTRAHLNYYYYHACYYYYFSELDKLLFSCTHLNALLTPIDIKCRSSKPTRDKLKGGLRKTRIICPSCAIWAPCAFSGHAPDQTTRNTTTLAANLRSAVCSRGTGT